MKAFSMNIFVCVKQVPLAQCEIQIDVSDKTIEQDDLVWTANPEDECAVEVALRIREQSEDVNITALRVGSEAQEEALITAMAMGADDAVLVEAPQDLDPHCTAMALQGAIEHTGKQPDLILCGSTAYDYDNHQVPQLLAMLLDIPALCGAVSCRIDAGVLTVSRQVEAGVTEVYKAETPLLIACSYGIAEPRYASLPHVNRARKKPFIKLALSDVGVDVSEQRLRYFNYRLPEAKAPGKVFDARDDSRLSEVVHEAMTLLQSEVKCI